MNAMTVNDGKPRQLQFSFLTPTVALKRGRRPSRYLQMLSLLKTAHRAKQGMPSYRQICDAMGLASRANVRQLVVYGERRGELRRVAGGRRIGLVEGVA